METPPESPPEAKRSGDEAPARPPPPPPPPSRPESPGSVYHTIGTRTPSPAVSKKSTATPRSAATPETAFRTIASAPASASVERSESQNPPPPPPPPPPAGRRSPAGALPAGALPAGALPAGALPTTTTYHEHPWPQLPPIITESPLINAHNSPQNWFPQPPPQPQSAGGNGNGGGSRKKRPHSFSLPSYDPITEEDQTTPRNRRSSRSSYYPPMPLYPMEHGYHYPPPPPPAYPSYNEPLYTFPRAHYQDEYIYAPPKRGRRARRPSVPEDSGALVKLHGGALGGQSASRSRSRSESDIDCAVEGGWTTRETSLSRPEEEEKEQRPPSPAPPVKHGSPKKEQSKHEQPEHEQPKHEQPKHEQPKHEQPKHEQPKIEQPKIEQPKIEQPKMEQLPQAEKGAASPPTPSKPTSHSPALPLHHRFPELNHLVLRHMEEELQLLSRTLSGQTPPDAQLVAATTWKLQQYSSVPHTLSSHPKADIFQTKRCGHTKHSYPSQPQAMWRYHSINNAIPQRKQRT
jgi:hypothetical protein